MNIYECQAAKLLRSLNDKIKDADCVQSNQGKQLNFTDGTWSQIFPKELREKIAISIPPIHNDILATLEKLRLILLKKEPDPGERFSIKDISPNNLVEWLSNHQIPLQTMKITNEKIKFLLPKLEYIDLTGFSEKDVTVLLKKKLKNVRHLTCQLTDLDLVRVTTFTTLTHLNLSNSKNLTNAGFGNLSDLTNLIYLDISLCTQITDVELQFLQGLLPETTIKHSL